MQVNEEDFKDALIKVSFRVLHTLRMLFVRLVFAAIKEALCIVS